MFQTQNFGDRLNEINLNCTYTFIKAVYHPDNSHLVKLYSIILHNTAALCLTQVDRFCFTVPPKFTGGDLLDPLTTDSLSVVLNSTLTLECPVDAVPPPTVVWYLDGNMIRSSERVRFLNVSITRENLH